ncbi:MAG: DUF3108 domain-containing protein, partial [Pyrinomonadaceae bacterium]
MYNSSGAWFALSLVNYDAMVNLSLKVPFILKLSLLILALTVPIFGQEKQSADPFPFSSDIYRVGEHLTYNVSFSNFPSAAHVEVQIVSRSAAFGRDAVQLHAHVETMGVVNVALLSLNNDYTTFIDPATGLPFRAQEVVREATRSNDNSRDFTQPAGTVALPAKQRAFPGTYDLLSAFYRARALPLAPGASYGFSVRGEAEDYAGELRVIGREVVKTNVGSFNCIVTQIKVANNDRINDYRLKVYFSEDERHVPVLVTAKVSTGQLTAELAGSEFIAPRPATPAPTPQVIPAQSPTPLPVATPLPSAPNEDWPFAVGEQLNYQVFLGGSNAPVGIATFQVRGRSRYSEHDGFYFSVKAQTTGAVARLFVANDEAQSYVDPQTLLPFRT